MTPYRPTVSTPATLSAPGWVEGEVGGLQVFRSPDSATVTPRSSVPYTLKYAFTPDWGVRLGGEALARAPDDSGGHAVGFGDTDLVLKRRFAIDDATALGLEAGVLIPTARSALQVGSGKPDWSLNGIYSADLGAWHADVNVTGTRLGGHDPSTSRWQALGAVAVARPVSERWGAFAEWSGTRETGASGTAQLLGGATFTARPDLVFDLGVAHGLNPATPHWQAFAGATFLIGRLR